MGALPAAAPAPWGPAPPAPMEGDAPWKVMPCQPTTQSYSHQEIHREFLAHLKLNLFKPINSLFIGNSCRAWNSADALQLPPSPSPGIKPPSTAVLLSSWGCCGGGGSACTGCCPPTPPHVYSWALPGPLLAAALPAVGLGSRWCTDRVLAAGSGTSWVLLWLPPALGARASNWSCVRGLGPSLWSVRLQGSG